MKRKLHLSIVLLSIVLLAFGVALHASEPPHLVNMPPELRPVHPPTAFPNLPTIPYTGLTLDRLEAAHLSGPLYYAIKRLLVPPVPSITSTGSAIPARRRSVDHVIGSDRTLIPAPLLAKGDSVNASADSQQDAEATVVAFDKAGSTQTVTAAIKYNPATSIGRIVAGSSASFTPGSFSQQELPIPAGYSSEADPVLAANVVSGGVWPLRVYCAGLLFNASTDPNGSYYLPSSIGLWHSDDGGVNWSLPSGVAWQFGNGLVDDKPTVAVSYYSSTLGDVYVSWTIQNLTTPTQSSIWVSRSTDGGASFEAPVVISYDNVQSPALAVDANTGTVYVAWVNWRTNQILAAQSSGSRSQPLSFGNYTVITSDGVSKGNMNGTIRYETSPAARYNWVTQRLMVVWTANTNTSGLDVYYSFYPCQADCNYWSWKNRVQLATNPINDQFMPAVDFLGSGDVMVSFYDRRDPPPPGYSSVNFFYNEYVAELHSDGTGLQNIPISDKQSNPN